MRALDITVLAVIAAGVVCGCGDSTVPEAGGKVTGMVVDAAGDPVPGAHINFGYEVVFAQEDGMSAAATIEPRDGTLEIFDHLETPIRTIEFTKEDMALFWDGKNEDGRPVPSGIYRYVLTLLEEAALDEEPDVQVISRWLALMIDLSQEHETWVERADGNGRFAIPVERIPVWEDYGLRTSNPEGPEGGTPFWLSRTVTVRAHRPGVANPHASGEIALEDPLASFEVTLTIPE